MKGKSSEPRILRNKLWELCKKIVRKRYLRPDGNWSCYTCEALITDPRSAHTGHMIPRSTGGALLYYHLDNLRVQCPWCNLREGGQGALFLRNLIAEIGDARVDALLELRRQTVKADKLFYLEKIEEYERLV